ncbi:taste receptor type 2 member 4-like [Dendropsophus ebraccatus]|uniref:taste receptor type 2 member 4-like n=1 Tax=Dendropsophus ebraccatus TaxID=150705 RepID=UPI003831AD86
MASSIEDKHNVHHASLAAAVLTFLIGLMTQLFIVVVNIMDWVRGRPKIPIDQVITSLGITRIFLHFLSFLNAMCMIFLRNYRESNLLIFINLFANFFNLSDIWLGTLFSAIFCMKICNFHNPVFLYLKRLISQKVVHLIVALVFMSVCYVTMVNVTHYIITSNVQLQNFTSNETGVLETRHIYIFVTIENSIPFLMYCTFSLLLIVSLCLHLNRMKSNNNVSTNLTSYYKAIQFMIICLVLFMLRIGCSVVILCFFYLLDAVLLYIIRNSAAILNSIYLIYRTNKLSNRLLKILYCGTNFLFHWAGSASNCGDQEVTTATA